MVAENYLKIFRALPSKWHRCTVCRYMYISQLFDLMHFSILGAVFILHSPYFIVTKTQVRSSDGNTAYKGHFAKVACLIVIKCFQYTL